MRYVFIKLMTGLMVISSMRSYFSCESLEEMEQALKSAIGFEEGVMSLRADVFRLMS